MYAIRPCPNSATHVRRIALRRIATIAPVEEDGAQDPDRGRSAPTTYRITVRYRFRSPVRCEGGLLPFEIQWFNVAPAIEDSLDFMNETICHLAPLDLLHIYGKHDVELMAEI